MHPLEAPRRQAVVPLLLPERPGPQIGLHVIRSGLGECRVDRWPEPRVAVLRVGLGVAIAGDPGALDLGELRALGIVGFVHAHEQFEPVLKEACGDVRRSPTVVSLLGDVPPPPAPRGVEIRRLVPGDEAQLARLDPSVHWIADSWAGPAGLAASGLAFGAFSEGRLASVAAAFTLGERIEDVGVVTDPGFRGRGLSPCCAARVAADVRARGREPSWTTMPHNAPSLRVAAKLGAVRVREGFEFHVGIRTPRVAERPGVS